MKGQFIATGIWLKEAPWESKALQVNNGGKLYPSLGLKGMVFLEAGGSWMQTGISQTQAETRGLEAQETYGRHVSLCGPRAQDREGKQMIWVKGMNGKEHTPVIPASPSCPANR